MSDRHSIGSILRITMPGDVTRRCKILAFDDDLVLVEWVDYRITNEWIPERWL